MRERGYLHPADNLAGLGIPLLHFVVQRRYASGVGRENDVVSVGIHDVTAVAGGGKERVRSTNQYREIGLIGVWNLCVIDGDRALIAKTVGVRQNHRGRGALAGI